MLAKGVSASSAGFSKVVFNAECFYLLHFCVFVFCILSYQRNPVDIITSLLFCFAASTSTNESTSTALDDYCYGCKLNAFI